MLRLILSLIAAATLAGTTGCSLVINGEDYLRDGGAIADGAVTDGAPADADAGTPDAGDANVPNRAPILSGVALSSYSPLPGDTLVALLGPTHDPDGDALSPEIVWTRNDVEVGFGDSLLLDPTVFMVGDEIRVTLNVSDGELAASRSAGPAIIEDDTVTRWRMLLPPRGMEGHRALQMFDPVRQRLLYRAASADEEHGLWERQITDGTNERWVRTRATGAPPPLGGGATLYDPVADRILVFGGGSFSGDMVGNRLYALDVSAPQGAESWTEVVPAGTPPSGRFGATLAYDPSRHVAFLVQGAGSGLTYATTFHRLVLDEGAERWELIDLPPGTLPARLGSAAVVDTARDRLILFGGGLPLVAGAESPEPVDEIWTLDLAAPESGFQLQVAELPSDLLAGFAFIEGDHATVLTGFNSVALNELAFEIDLETFAVSEHTLDPPVTGLFATGGTRAPFDTGYVVMAQHPDKADMDASSVTRAAPYETAPLTGPGVDLPPPMYQGTAESVRTLTLVGGRQARDGGSTVVNGDVYEWSEGRWQLVSTTSDPAVGEPEPFYGLTYDGSDVFEYGVMDFVGGLTAAGTADDGLWTLDDGNWSRAVLRAGEAGPPARFGHALFRSGCGAPGRAHVLGFYGGRSPDTNVVSQEVWIGQCDNAPGTMPHRDCLWYSTMVDDASSPPRSFFGAAVQVSEKDAVEERITVAFGGADESGTVMSSTYTFNPCAEAAGTDEARQLVPIGTLPPPRMGHSLSQSRGATPERADGAFLFGGGTTEQGGGVMNDVWQMRVAFGGSFTLETVSFEPLTVAAGERPAPRMFHYAVYDRAQDRLFVYGGLAGDEQPLGDLWELRIR